jgi:3-hydroxyacyl-CoA dehydrogenase
MSAETVVTPAATGTSQARPVGASILIRKAAVLGAGTMGSRIAAHLANAGLPVVLLDIPAPSGPRGSIAAQALEQLRHAKPAALFDKAFAGRITTGNFDDDMALLADCDWVIEAVAENLAIKRGLLEKVVKHLKKGAVLSTNTSGLPIASIAAHLGEDVRKRWLGAHFFNPPRYMRLVEIITTPETDPAVTAAITEFSDHRLGKDVVFARDTPNFIANRIGVFIMLEAVRLLQEEDLTIEEVDALTGSAIGWPRTGTFRLADMVGIDVLAHVAANFARSGASAGGHAVVVPPFIQTMLERRWLGDKTKQGFYRKTRSESGEEIRQVIDWKTLEYRPSQHPKLPTLDMAKNLENVADRVRQLLSGDVKRDKAARFHWRLMSALWNYAADCLPEIADDAASIDRAMRAGFNWEMGPFELWDAAGVRKTVERMKLAGEPVSPIVEKLLAAGGESWYRAGENFNPATDGYRPIPTPEGMARVATYKASNGVVKKNAGASLVDIGEGVGCIELHSVKNAIGGDIVRLVTEALDPSSEPVRRFEAFVISGDADNFSVGANLMQLLISAQEEEWDEVEFAIRAFQKMTQAIKFCPRPVVVAPFGMCLGGGAEMTLHGAGRQAHAELYMGLVEAGVGLLPGGGGCKEMVLRAVDAVAAVHEKGRTESVELLEAMKHALEVVAMAKVSTSAVEAKRLGLIYPSDGITMNRGRLLNDARRHARELARAGFVAPLARHNIHAPGENILATLELGIYTMRQGEFISEHDAKVARKIAYVLCGGRVTPGSPMTEQYLLDLEREAFLSLCGERKTQERIAFTLKTGKPLRN